MTDIMKEKGRDWGVTREGRDVRLTSITRSLGREDRTAVLCLGFDGWRQKRGNVGSGGQRAVASYDDPRRLTKLAPLYTVLNCDMTEGIKTISLNYNIFPPPGIDPADIKKDSRIVPPIAEISFSIKTASTSQSPTSTYYKSASIALRDAQSALNEILTPWKNAIGDKEKIKEDLGKVGYGKGRAARMSAGVDPTVIPMTNTRAGEVDKEVDGDEDEIVDD